MYIVHDMRQDMAELAALLHYLGQHIQKAHLKDLKIWKGEILSLTLEHRSEIYAGALRYVKLPTLAASLMRKGFRGLLARCSDR